MAPKLKLYLFPFFLLFFLQPLINCQFCQEASCGTVSIDFPFRLTDQPYCCGDPNFSISCIDQAQTIIAFPFSGEFMVDDISYSTPNLLISDPEFCVPKRLLRGLDLYGTPFKPQYPESYMFFNCSSDVSIDYPAIGFSCLSGKNFSVLAIPTIAYNHSSSLRSCLELAKILVPLPFPDWPRYYMDNLLLTWENPDCLSSCNNYCESRVQPAGSNCELENRDGVDGGCSSDHLFKKKSGLSSGTKYALIFILGAPIFLILVYIIHLNIRVHCYHDQLLLPQSNIELSSLATEPRSAASTIHGLDGPRIEAYPITVLDESCRLPRPNDNTCSICLSEYKAKETIRTIPDCDHYFHADCIDEWLKLNAACPVCRKTPDQDSALITHSTLSSSSPPPHR
ncbi:hypothetical protein PTKIN_Ptkin04bG0175600 [Pterospermum kingtungense]